MRKAARGISYIACGILLFLAGTVLADEGFPVTVQDGLGRSVTIRSKPERIVSLSPAMTENLYLLGSGDRIVGNTIYCEHPEAAKHTEKVGTITSPGIEKVISLRPDLVVLTDAVIQKGLIKRVENMGIVTYAFRPSGNFKELCEDFIKLGDLIGRGERARWLVEKAERRVAAVTGKVAGRPLVTVFWQVGANPLFTAARETFADDLIKLAGGKNVAAQYGTQYPQLSREEVITSDPEVIMIVTMGEVTAKEKEIWQRFSDLQAVQNGRIHVVEAHKFCSPTPVTFAEAVEDVAGYLHPDLSKEQDGALRQ
ncbi:MAG: helical backbone metal receptor [Candidatus Omnitrophota bacterium]